MTGLMPQPPGHERVLVVDWRKGRVAIRCNCGLNTRAGGRGLLPRAEAERIYDNHLVELGLDRYLERTAP